MKFLEIFRAQQLLGQHFFGQTEVCVKKCFGLTKSNQKNVLYKIASLAGGESREKMKNSIF